MTVVNQMGIQALLADDVKHFHKFNNMFKRKTICPFSAVRLPSRWWPMLVTSHHAFSQLSLLQPPPITPRKAISLKYDPTPDGMASEKPRRVYLLPLHQIEKHNLLSEPR